MVSRVAAAAAGFVESHALAGVHLQVGVDDLEKFRGLRNSARFELGPHGHVVDGDLKGAGGHELTLNGVGDEEEHHAGVHLVLEGPGEGRRRVHAHHRKGVEGGQDANDKRELQVALKTPSHLLNKAS